MTISPGSSVLSELKLQIPPAALKGRRYITTARIANAVYTFNFNPSEF